jgi:hypothetical protein
VHVEMDAGTGKLISRAPHEPAPHEAHEPAVKN